MKEKENKENKILKAAIKVFSKKGYDLATVDEIAKEAKVSKGIIFFYYKKKDNLIKNAAIKSVPVEEITAVNKRDHKDARELLMDFGLSFLKKYENPELRNLLLKTMANRERFKQIDNALRLVCFQEMDMIFSKLEKFVDQNIPVPVRRGFLGSLLCYVIWWNDNEMSPEDYVRTLTDSFLNIFSKKE